MDPFDRYLRRPLDELLVTQGVLTREKADEIRESAHAAGEPFAAAVLGAGAMSPWDLTKLIATHYQMPVQPLEGYRLDRDLFEGLHSEVLHRFRVVPLGQFGRARTFAVLEPPGRELLDDLVATCGPHLFFFVSQGPEIDRILRDTVKLIDTAKDTTWQKLFDSAEEEISKGLSAPHTDV